MNRSISTLVAGIVLLSAAASAAETSDPAQQHRWHMPRRGARSHPAGTVSPLHAEWNRLAQLANTGKEVLQDWGITFDTDLALFGQHVSRVASGQKSFGTFSWRVMGDWKLFDLRDDPSLAGIGQGFVGWTGFGTAGLNYNRESRSPTANAGTVNILNATVFDEGGVVDELYWKQVALGGKLLVLAGRVDMAYHFDTNRVANDGFSQFFSYSLQNNASIPAPVYGGLGGLVRVNLPEQVYVMVGAGDSSTNEAELAWKTLDNDSWYQLVELGLSAEIPLLGKGSYRLTPWHNHFFGSDGFGVALNVDQELGREDLVAFFRFGHGDEDVTAVKTFVSGGVGFEAPFGRAHDLAGIGVAWSDPSSGEGDRDETLVELFYRVEVAQAISITPDLQFVFDPADNPGDDFAIVPGIRLLVKF